MGGLRAAAHVKSAESGQTTLAGTQFNAIPMRGKCWILDDDDEEGRGTERDLSFAS